MRTYLVCDQDGFVADSQEGDIAHYATNPTHTSHVGIGGNSSNPVPYTSGSATVLQSYTTGLTVDTNTQVLFGMDISFISSTSDLIVNGMLIGVQ